MPDSVLLREVGVVDYMGQPMLAEHRMTAYHAGQVLSQAPVYPRWMRGGGMEGEMLGESRLSRRRILATSVILAVLAFAPCSQKNSGVLERPCDSAEPLPSRAPYLRGLLLRQMD